LPKSLVAMFAYSPIYHDDEQQWKNSNFVGLFIGEVRLTSLHHCSFFIYGHR